MSTGDSDTIAATETAETTHDSGTNRRQPFPQGFLDTISTGWAPRPDSAPPQRDQATRMQSERRAGVSVVAAAIQHVERAVDGRCQRQMEV